MQEKYLYICDKKPGACSGWGKDGYEISENEMCFHTPNIEHAKYKHEPVQKFAKVKQSDDVMLLFEYCRVCPHDGLRCAYKMGKVAGYGDLCTLKENLLCEGLRH